MGLVAASLASASPPTYLVGNLEPKVVSGVMQDDQQEVFSAGTIASNAVITANDFAYDQAYGQETVHEWWTHSVPTNALLGRYAYNFNAFGNHVNPSAALIGAPTSLLVIDQRWRSCNCMFVSSEKIYHLDVSNTGPASATAAPASISRHFVAWVTSYLSGSDLRR